MKRPVEDVVATRRSDPARSRENGARLCIWVTKGSKWGRRRDPGSRHHGGRLKRRKEWTINHRMAKKALEP